MREQVSVQSNCTSCASIAPLLLLDISERYNKLVEVLEEIVVVVNLNVSAVLLLPYNTARGIMRPPDLPVPIVPKLHLGKQHSL